GCPNGRCRTPHCGGISWRSWISDTPPAAGQRRSTGPQPGPAGADWARNFGVLRAGQRTGKEISRKHLPPQPAATLPRSWWRTGPAGYRAGSEEPAFSHSAASSFQLLPLVPVHNRIFDKRLEVAELGQHRRALAAVCLLDLLLI